MRILSQEIVHFYNAIVTGQNIARGWPAARNWRRFVLEQHARTSGEPGRASLGYWLNCYRTLPEPLALPTARPRGATMGFGASNLQFSLTPTLWARLKAPARNLTVTPRSERRRVGKCG